MEKESMISIVIPIYNAECYLEACLDSVLGQTYSNIEVILVNDGSTDGSLEICEYYAEKDSRIILINQKNAGVSVARNNGIRASNGAFLMFVDADDIIAPDICEYAYNGIQGYDVLFWGVESFDSSEEVHYQHVQTDICVLEYSKQAWLRHLLRGGDGSLPNLNSMCAKLYKKSFVLINEIACPSEICVGEDMLFNLQIYMKEPRICYIPVKAYFYRYNQASAVHGYNPHFLENDRKFYEVLKKILDQEGLWEAVLDDVGYQQMNGLLLVLTNDIFHPHNPKTAGEKKMDFLALSEHEVYRIIYREQLYKFKPINRCILYLAYNKQYFLLKLLYWLKFWIKNTLN